MSKGFKGASAAKNAVVMELQTRLKAYAGEQGNVDYDPGLLDGQYGQNTHAAIIRFARDVLEPAGRSSSTCRSTCNTQWLRAIDACGTCLGTMLRAMATDASSNGVVMSLGALGPMGGEGMLPGLTMTDGEIDSVVSSYQEWLRAYVAYYGDGGELDPAQIMRREEVERAEAERLAAERRAAEEAAARAAAGAPVVQKAGFPWWWVIVFAGVGGGIWYWQSQQKKGKLPKPVQRGRKVRRGKMDFSGLGRLGCGCDGGM